MNWRCSLTIAREYAQADPRVKVIAASHQGIAPALKSAIAATTGTYLGWVDSDDRLAPTALEETVAVLNAQPEVGLVYTHYRVIDEQGNVVLEVGDRCKIPYSPERLLVDFMTFHFRLLRRSAYDQVGGIDPSFAWAEDYDLCLKLSELTDIQQVQKPLYDYRRHANNITNHQLEAIRWAAIAISNAITRRRLDHRYQLDVQVVSYFKLLPKASSPTPHQSSIPQFAAPPTSPPLVSIIIPCYNAAPRLEACLNSCLQQSYPKLEIVVVDNNSTDQTPEIAERFAAIAPDTFRLVRCQRQGANQARNAGFAQAQGDYIQWLDADDELDSQKLAIQVAALEQNQNYDIAYGDWDWCCLNLPQGNIQFTFTGTQYKDFLLQLLVDNWRPPHAYLLRRSTAEQLHQIQAWNPATTIGMDREYFTLAALLGSNFLYVADSKVRYYRWSPTQLTQSTSYQERVRSRSRMFRRFQDLAAVRLQQPLQRLHGLLLGQSWDLWHPSYSLLQQTDQTVWVQQHQTQDVLVFQGWEATILRTLLQSPSDRTFEDHARTIIGQLWCETLLRISRSDSPERIFNFAQMSVELAKQAGLTSEPEEIDATLAKVQETAQMGLTFTNDIPETASSLALHPLLLDVPLFAPLFGEHRLMVYTVLNRLVQHE